ncbi:NrsF family protein [Pleomorphomonas sp. PLEO]|uniref:NrsF family protein n=1 Tax=Pleomorphomonas sp. PLEO TaxID=3239306 RepID=UPI00351E2384
MQTDDLINLLAKDARTSVRFGHVFLIALVIGVVISALLLLSTLGIRKNMVEAIETPRVMFKLGLTLLLAITSTRLAFLIGKPGVSLRAAALALLLPLTALLIGIAAELFVVPRAAWGTSLEGHFSSFCLVFVPMLSIAPLAAILYSVRQGAPESPGKAGAVAGLAASGIAAAIYAWHCPDDSPLFLATWYALGILVVTAAGFLLGRRVLRW